MRIVTRPDFDGVVCALLLIEAEKISAPVKWVQPDEIQHRRIKIDREDILANLPYDSHCKLWFDHHYSNMPVHNFSGSFRLAPSAARVIFEFYQGRFRKNFSRLVKEADRIDSADLSLEEVRHPENSPYFLLSMTVSPSGHNMVDEDYMARVISLLRTMPVEDVLADAIIKEKCSKTLEEIGDFEDILKTHTQVRGHLTVTDFRSIYPVPSGNRFLVYLLYPETSVHVEIGYKDPQKTEVRLRAGRNIFNGRCNVNLGMLFSRYGGGGHRGAAGCIFPAHKADSYVPEIIDTLIENKSNEEIGRSHF